MDFGYEVFHPSVATLVDFYTRVLGFTVDDGAGVTGDVEYLAVRRDDVVVGCCRHAQATMAERRPPAGSEVVLRADDVQEELARVTAAGWPLADALQERPWGMTDFRVFDPSGQYIRITGPRAS